MSECIFMNGIQGHWYSDGCFLHRHCTGPRSWCMLSVLIMSTKLTYVGAPWWCDFIASWFWWNIGRREVPARTVTGEFWGMVCSMASKSVCNCAMCVSREAVEDSQDATSSRRRRRGKLDGWFCFEHMRFAFTHEGCFVAFTIRFDLKWLSIINVWRAN